jgi:integrase
MNKLPKFALGTSNATALAEIIAGLPPLPRKILYEDDYDEVVRSIMADSAEDGFELVVSGQYLKLNLFAFEQPVRVLICHFLLSEVLVAAPASVVLYYSGLRNFSGSLLTEIVLSEPLVLKTRWANITNGRSRDEYIALKAFLSFLCCTELGTWEPRYRTLVKGLPSPRRDQYAVIRSGDCFLEIEEEAALVRWIDQAVATVDSRSQDELRVASLVVCSYQFGMRPKQLGTLRKRDCEVRVNKEDGQRSVYLTFRTLKQQDVQASRLPLLRRVKREWAPLVAATFDLLSNEPPSAFFFGFKSRNALSVALIKQLDTILPGNGRDAYSLRHSMVQRMVDAGASQEEVAAALGHTHLKTGLVYFRASANQAELVNKALGLSDTYQMVAKIAADQFISEEDLFRLKGEQQIAGVPHGIPIAGIGGCMTGQPSCPYNPVTACYGCPKFMPVRDVALHEQVLKDFRSVVNDFKVAGAGDQESPAYLQLRRTIAEVKGVINQLEGQDDQ